MTTFHILGMVRLCALVITAFLGLRSAKFERGNRDTQDLRRCLGQMFAYFSSKYLRISLESLPRAIHWSAPASSTRVLLLGPAVMLRHTLCVPVLRTARG